MLPTCLCLPFPLVQRNQGTVVPVPVVLLVSTQQVWNLYCRASSYRQLLDPALPANEAGRRAVVCQQQPHRPRRDHSLHRCPHSSKSANDLTTPLLPLTARTPAQQPSNPKMSRTKRKTTSPSSRKSRRNSKHAPHGCTKVPMSLLCSDTVRQAR